MKHLRVTKDRVTEVLGALSELVGKQVLVGFPESTTERDDESGAPMTNATLGYIHETGSPAANIPARPFLVPGVEAAQDRAVERLERAAKATLSGDARKADVMLQEAGIIASNSVKRKINSNIPPPLKPSTVRNRRRSRDTKSQREAESVYLGLVAKGVTPEAAQSEVGIVSLVNTGQLRNAVTSVVRKRK